MTPREEIIPLQVKSCREDSQSEPKPSTNENRSRLRSVEDCSPYCPMSSDSSDEGTISQESSGEQIVAPIESSGSTCSATKVAHLPPADSSKVHSTDDFHVQASTVKCESTEETSSLQKSKEMQDEPQTSSEETLANPISPPAGNQDASPAVKVQQESPPLPQDRDCKASSDMCEDNSSRTHPEKEEEEAKLESSSCSAEKEVVGPMNDQESYKEENRISPDVALALKKPDWSSQQHRDFTKAIFSIGLKSCSPSVIMDAMKTLPSDISREKTKSHLQKFRKTTEKSIGEFMEEYDGFFKMIRVEQGKNQLMKKGKPSPSETDSTSGTAKSLSPEALLADKVLKGQDPYDVLGGAAAAHVAYRVEKKCPVKNSEKIEYKAAPAMFPVLTEAEQETEIGESLTQVHGALKFLAEFMLKKRHSVPMKIEKIPPFLKTKSGAVLASIYDPAPDAEKHKANKPMSMPKMAPPSSTAASTAASMGGYPQVPPPPPPPHAASQTSTGHWPNGAYGHVGASALPHYPAQSGQAPYYPNSYPPSSYPYYPPTSSQGYSAAPYYAGQQPYGGEYGSSYYQQQYPAPNPQQYPNTSYPASTGYPADGYGSTYGPESTQYPQYPPKLPTGHPEPVDSHDSGNYSSYKNQHYPERAPQSGHSAQDHEPIPSSSLMHLESPNPHERRHRDWSSRVSSSRKSSGQRRRKRAVASPPSPIVTTKTHAKRMKFEKDEPDRERPSSALSLTMEDLGLTIDQGTPSNDGISPAGSFHRDMTWEPPPAVASESSHGRRSPTNDWDYQSDRRHHRHRREGLNEVDASDDKFSFEFSFGGRRSL